ncbi:uncharacterized protein LOC108907565 [Anoplophora glabripennis]|uniref:uncharacterized protein LOC108907565 n=1 Tax=Anoplophora glabripennis TaxID=217634 RepID=UPI00087550EF|nr:uncharacterized protein LOC108907565 [Anoplophora glabripennis]
MCSIVPPQIYETLKKVVKGDINNFEIVIHDANKKGEGFLGDMVFVTLENKQSNEVIDLVVKQAFTKQIIRDMTPIRQVFMNEIYFYTQAWKHLNKFQRSIPMHLQFHKVPKCFTSISEDGSEKLVLENLKFQKFEMHNKKIPLDKQHFELIFREYGKFHALSFAYKCLYPEDYADLAKGIIDVYSYFMNMDGFTKSIDAIYDLVMDSLQPRIDDVVIEKFRPYFENHMELFRDSIDCNTKYSVITHGDCWSNNMMFKYSEDRRLVDIRFLDFQLSKEGSPCCDLSYCFYSGASDEMLKDLDYFLQIYHESLSKTLKAFGCDPEKLYPFQELKNDWKKYCKMGVTMALMVWKIKCTSEENIIDLNDVDRPAEERERAYSVYDKDAFQKICRNLIFHLHENDYL